MDVGWGGRLRAWAGRARQVPQVPCLSDDGRGGLRAKQTSSKQGTQGERVRDRGTGVL